MSATAIAPSPTAPATRLIEPCRMSPATNTPGTLASSAGGGVTDAHVGLASPGPGEIQTSDSAYLALRPRPCGRG